MVKKIIWTCGCVQEDASDIGHFLTGIEMESDTLSGDLCPQHREMLLGKFLRELTESEKEIRNDLLKQFGFKK